VLPRPLQHLQVPARSGGGHKSSSSNHSRAPAPTELPPGAAPLAAAAHTPHPTGSVSPRPPQHLWLPALSGASDLRRARAHESAPPSPSTPALNARRRHRHCRSRRLPLARARPRSARAPLASPSVECLSRARVGSHHLTPVLQSNARKFKPQVHR